MLKHCLYIGVVSLCLSGMSRPTQAADAAEVQSVALPAPTTSPTSSVTASPTTTLPAGSTAPADVSENRKFYTISCSLREIYDTNIFTATTGRIASFETEVSPSILFDFPMENSDFSMRETFDATYYSNRPGSQWDFDDEVVAQFQHQFSDRFSLNMAEQFRYYTEPSLFQNVGTLYYNGAYISNTFNGSFNAQWTPLVSTVFSYSNTVVDYMQQQTATGNNSVENTGSATLGFAILPKITLTFGGIFDDISYGQIDRGYTTYTGTVGANWQALPSLSLNVAVGGSLTQTDLGTSEPTPYASLALNWQLGARSSLNFNYSHEIVPSDVVQSMGQIADRFGTLFHYDITSSISAHLEGTFTHGIYTPFLLSPNTISGFSENDFAIDAGLTYHINSHFDVNLGNTYSGVASGLSFRDYNRDQVYLGVRGTY